MTILIQNIQSLTNCKFRFQKYIFFFHLNDFSRKQVKSDPWKLNENSFPIGLPFIISPYSGGNESYFLSFVCLCGFHSISAYCYENLKSSYLETNLQLWGRNVRCQSRRANIFIEQFRTAFSCYKTQFWWNTLVIGHSLTHSLTLNCITNHSTLDKACEHNLNFCCWK